MAFVEVSDNSTGDNESNLGIFVYLYSNVIGASETRLTGLTEVSCN